MLHSLLPLFISTALCKKSYDYGNYDYSYWYNDNDPSEYDYWDYYDDYFDDGWKFCEGQFCSNRKLSVSSEDEVSDPETNLVEIKENRKVYHVQSAIQACTPSLTVKVKPTYYVFHLYLESFNFLSGFF